MTPNATRNGGEVPIAVPRIGRLASAAKSFTKLIVAGVLAGAATLAVAAPASADVIRIEHVSSGRFLDAWETSTYDFRAVVWSHQDNDTQLWKRTQISGNIYTLQQVSNDRYLDAHQNDANDWNVVTRPNQNNDTQRWIMTDLGGGVFHIQQASSGRYLDAWQSAEQGWRAVTRPWQGNTTQQWRVTVVPQLLVPVPGVLIPPPGSPPPPPAVHSSGSFEWGSPFSADFDNGTVVVNGGDINYFAPDLVNLQLMPAGGAQISFTDGSQRGYAGCSSAAFSNAPVQLASIPVGGYVCVRTGDGRISEFRINSVGPVLKILSVNYTTWQ